jgi:membrane-bound lytic murein transglycosylase B
MPKQTLTRCIAAMIICALVSIPAQALDLKRSDVSSFIDKMVTTYQFDRVQLEDTLRGAESKQPILDAISKPAEKTVPWFEYRDRFLVDKRINRGKSFQLEHQAMLNKLASDGAPVAEILGILGVETMYGEITGRYRVLDALATLGFDYPPRAEFFRYELEQFLLMSREQQLRADQPLGSYAGAMGAPQFMPHSYRQYAIDGNGDGKVDLWNNWDDVLASVANYLKQYGWRNGEPVVADAVLTSMDTSAFTLGDVTLNETVGSLHAKGVKFTTTLPDTAPAVLLSLQGKDGPVYRVGFNNFYVITRYNRSPLYANTVYDLGQLIMNKNTALVQQPMSK